MLGKRLGHQRKRGRDESSVFEGADGEDTGDLNNQDDQKMRAVRRKRRKTPGGGGHSVESYFTHEGTVKKRGDKQLVELGNLALKSM